MKRLLCAVSVLALLIPGVAAAQQQTDRHRNGAQGQHHNRPSRPNQRPDRPVTIQPVKPNRPNPHRPGHRPPVTIQPVRPHPGHRPGYRPPHVRPIHRPHYRYPYGYHYRRWHAGLILPHVFLSNYYYFNDWGDLGIGPPPPGYIWVRYGPDLLLVNRYNGRIRDVIYGAFY